jgi:hypothetical protein
MPPTAPELELSTTSRVSSGYDDWKTPTNWSSSEDYVRFPPLDLTSAFDRAINAALDCLAALKPNWDADGANPISPGIIEAAREFMRRLPNSMKAAGNIPAVTPMRKGNLQFEWHDGPKTLELEIENPQTIHYLKWHSEAGIEEEEFCEISDAETVTELIRWFLEG